MDNAIRQVLALNFGQIPCITKILEASGDTRSKHQCKYWRLFI